MTDRLRVAAQAALDDLEARCGTNAAERGPDGSITKLRAALAEQTVKESLTTRPSIIDSIADNLIGDHIALMNENWMLRAALAEQDAEPVAWMDIDSDGTRHGVRMWAEHGRDEVPLYTHPPRREWRGLTDEEIDRVTDAQWARGNNKPVYAAHRAYARAIEAALKEKNT